MGITFQEKKFVIHSEISEKLALFIFEIMVLLLGERIVQKEPK